MICMKVGHNNQNFIPLRWVGSEKVANGKFVAKAFQEHNDNMERDSPICAEESRQLNLKNEASFQHLRHWIDMKSVLLQKLKYP